MPGQHPPPTGVRTSADVLRDQLTQCEDWAAQIGKGTNGLALLQQLDDTVNQLEHLEARGVDLRAERGRLQHVFGQIRRHDKTLASQIGPALAANRPTAARWWWYLDEQVVATRQRREDDRVWSGISVIDTGPGIPPLEQPHLFERFFRGSAAYESGAPGTGLGLSIACEIIEKHDGKIEVKSDGIPGRGAEFTIWLPAK